MTFRADSAAPSSGDEAAPVARPIIEQLRAATSSAHKALEAELRLSRDDVTLADYRHYLARMLGLHAPFEHALDALPALRPLVPDFDARRRLPQLERDLQALGVDAAARAALPRAAVAELSLAQPASALGALYVIEGSTLGGQYLQRHLRARLGDDVATAYVGAYDDVGGMWKRFRGALDAFALAHPDEQPLIVAAAQRMFACVQAWLAGGGAHE